MRVTKGPTPIKRIAHGVMGTPKMVETLKWFREHLGFISSDDIYVGEEGQHHRVLQPLRSRRHYVDHHVFFCMAHETAGLNHLSFEVHDIDEVFIGHEYLTRLGKYEHMWGIGRHVLGSQVYDYWADPWGRVHEHWADSDRLNAANGSNLLTAEEGLNSQWGERAPEKFLNHASP